MRVISIAIALFRIATVAAQTPPVSDRFYQTIRQDDLTTVRALVRDQGANTIDAQGHTPLMLAAAFGSVEAVRTLIASGADVRHAGTAGITPLHLAADDPMKARLLLEAGADVNAASQLGRTPLIIAAANSQSAEVVRVLLSRGANVNAADSSGITPLIAAANSDNREAAELLLARGADPHVKAGINQAATALMGAAINGNHPLVRALLARKVNVADVSSERGQTAKNGMIKFAAVTALHLAITGGNADVVESLLKAGAPVNAADVRGMTPLVFAVATDRPNMRIVQLLVAHGADPSFRAQGGESPVEWARKFKDPAVLKALAVSTTPDNVIPAAPASSHLAASAREAVLRSLPLQRTASSRVMTDGGCSACHAQPLTVVAIDSARARGWTTLS